MSGRPQQPEIARSGRSPVDPDHTEERLTAESGKGQRGSGGLGPVPEANQPGHHPDVEQDKPASATAGDEELDVPEGERESGPVDGP